VFLAVVWNQSFFLGETILDTLPTAASIFVVGLYIIIEMTDMGNEGLTYGLLSSISNLGGSFARAIGNQVFGAWKWKHNLLGRQNYIDDKPGFRNAVALPFILGYGLPFLALGLLFLCSRHRSLTRRSSSAPGARIRGGHPRGVRTRLLIVIIPSIACLVFAGGKGC
jgi:hypothetical protein